MLSLLDPQTADAVYEQGNACARQGLLAEAVGHYRHAIALDPGFAAAHFDLANALVDQNADANEADACFRAALALRPDFLAAHNNLGTLLWQNGDLAGAADCFRRAIALDPGIASVHTSLGNVLALLEQHDEAEASFRRALAIDPHNVEALNNLATAHYAQEKLDAAVAYLRSAIRLAPDMPELHYNLGNALRNQGRLGDTPYHLDRLADAIVAFRHAVAIRPDYAEARSNLAHALLVRGDLRAGFEEYEWRWRTPGMERAHRHLQTPRWHGEPAVGKTLLIHAEQGFGDNIQFCRYAPLAAARGLRVVMEVPRPLVELLRTLPGVHAVVAQDDALPPFDLQCPMLSLPLAFGTTLRTIPCATPYLSADPRRGDAWRARLPTPSTRTLRVGLAWAREPRRHSRQLMTIDRRRSIGADRLVPLFDVPDVQFVSLQMEAPPATVPALHVLGGVHDFADTAALIANLDLVISIDVVIVHLAAALGKPVWMLDRTDHCWRWLAGREDSPWYPGLRIYRQTRPLQWDDVIMRVRNDLVALASARRALPC